MKDVGTALATWANAITAGRLLLSPLMFWLIPDDDAGSWVAFVFWFLLCVSDVVDGYIARRHGPTRSGAFLDPLADKVLVLGAMFTLVGRDVFWIVPVAIIAARELVISMYRSVVGTKGVAMPASRMAKYKTLAQQLAVGFALLPLTALDATWLWNACLWAGRRARRCTAAASTSGGCTRRRRGRSCRPTCRWSERRCAVTSWPSAPSCCSARSSTPTRRGSASSWPPTASPRWLQVKVGDNVERIENVLRQMLAEADAVIVCGGLGPTHDDVTREAIAAVMGVELELDDAVADVIRELFAQRGRPMSDNNLRQAMVPVGATVIPQTPRHGARADLPVPARWQRAGGLRRSRRARRDGGDARAGRAARTCSPAPASRPSSPAACCKVGGESESGLNERLDDVIARLDDDGDVTLAFLARGWNGLEVRLTTSAESAAAADDMLRPVGGGDPRPARQGRVRHRRRVDGVGGARRLAPARLDARASPSR